MLERITIFLASVDIPLKSGGSFDAQQFLLFLSARRWIAVLTLRSVGGASRFPCSRTSFPFF